MAEYSDEILMQLSNEDLDFISSGNYTSISEEGLAILTGTQVKVASEIDANTTWGEVAKSATESAPGSFVELGKGVVHAVTNPIDTGYMIIKLLSGGMQHLLPEGVVDFIDPEGRSAESKELASAIGQHYKKKYGSMAEIKKAIATDPAGVLADAATIFYGAGAALKAGQLSKIGTGVTKAGAIIDPINLAIQATSKTAGYAGGKVSQAITATTTGVGSSPLKTAFDAGKTGGEVLVNFTNNLRGKIPGLEALQIARANLQLLKQKRAKDYQKGMKDINKDPTELSFTKVDEALIKAQEAVKPKGIILDAKAQGILKKINKIVTEFKKSKNTANRTASGFDDMKQKIWNEISKIDRQKHPNAARILDDVYHQTKATIVEQAPNYANVMQEYAKATELLNEIQRTLSLGDKAMPDTALRKLQSIMRDNVNTNYGQRLNLMDELNAIEGSTDIMPVLAGQALSKYTPRGIQGATAPLLAASQYGIAGMPGLAASAAISSPRIMGEAFRAGGILERYIGQSPIMANKGGLLNLMYQADEQRER